MRQAALRSALSSKAAAEEIVILDELTLAEPKTKLMAQALEKIAGDVSTLILFPEKNVDYKVVELATRNLPDAKTLNVNYLNIRDLLGYQKIVLPLQALDKISGHLG
jgi:large subunit ribosomal protein L4